MCKAKGCYCHLNRNIIVQSYNERMNKKEWVVIIDLIGCQRRSEASAVRVDGAKITYSKCCPSGTLTATTAKK